MSLDFLSSLLGNVWSICMIVLFFGGSIFVHELGHFLAARRRGVKVERFSIGFGPAIWSRTGKDGVDYRLSWIPLGGYVLLPQLADLGAVEGEPTSDVAALPPVSYSTKVLVFVAGAFFNLLFAFSLATVLWIIGLPTSEEISTTRIGYVSKTIALENGANVPSPAAEAGLQIGDTIRAVDGVRVTEWLEFQQILTTTAGITDDGRREAQFTVERAGRTLELTLHPILAGANKDRRIGVLAAYTPIVATAPENSFAHKIGLRVDDQLQALDDAPLLNLLTVYDRLQEKTPRAFSLTVLRGAQSVEIIVPAERPKDAAPLFGASFRTKVGFSHQNPFAQISSHVAMTLRVFWSLIQPHSDIGISKMSGPVGIGRIFWDASEAGFRYVLWIAILVNVNLAIFNLLPIPVLDGGHILFATIGKLRGRVLSPTLIAATQSLFMILLLLMVGYVTVFGDIRRLVRDNKAEAVATEAAAQAAKKSPEPAPAGK